MQMILCFLAILLFLIISWIMGNIFLILIDDRNENKLLFGFFTYFFLFQVVYFPIMILLHPLSQLTLFWSLAVVLVVAIYIFFIKSKYKKIKVDVNKIKKVSFSPIFYVMIVLILIQVFYSVVNSQSSWDAAFYIPNVVKSISTDTIYVYDGSTGLKETVINFRYAISSFYIHDAVLGQLLGVHGAIICRWFNTIICHILSIILVYKIGKVLFIKTEQAIKLVCLWVMVNFGIGTIYFASTFLMSRGYEAKAYCCNVIIPAVIYIFIKIWKNPEKKEYWIELFLVNLSSVPVSASSLLVVPVLNGCLFLGHLFIDRKIKDLKMIILCLLPNIFYLILYFLYCMEVFLIKVA